MLTLRTSLFPAQSAATQPPRLGKRNRDQQPPSRAHRVVGYALLLHFLQPLARADCHQWNDRSRRRWRVPGRRSCRLTSNGCGTRKTDTAGLKTFTWSRTTDATLAALRCAGDSGERRLSVRRAWEKFDVLLRRGELPAVSHVLRWLWRAVPAARSRDLVLSTKRWRSTAATSRSRSARWCRTGRSGGCATIATRVTGPRTRCAGATRILPGSRSCRAPSFRPICSSTRSAISSRPRSASKTDDANWKVAGRYERTKVNNRHVARRRAGENQDRYVTTTEGTDAICFPVTDFYERIFHEKLRASAGGLITSIDTNITGEQDLRCDARMPNTPPRLRGGRRATSATIGLTGGTRMKQYLGNLNVFYQPAKYWIDSARAEIRAPAPDGDEGHIDTDFGGGAAAAAIQRQIGSGFSRNSWNEVTEELEVRYTRWARLDARPARPVEPRHRQPGGAKHPDVEQRAHPRS